MKRNILSFICLILLTACTKEDLTVQVVRNPVIRFELDSVSWKAGNYFFTGPANVVVYPANPTQPGMLYNRFTLQATGKDSKGTNLQLNIIFDAANPDQLTGSYRTNYTPAKGLHQVQLFTLGSTLTAYNLCAGDTTTPILNIDRQSIKEQLVSGSFSMTLCNTRDTTQKIRIKNGIMTDIHY
jgi:hypothetical protein